MFLQVDQLPARSHARGKGAHQAGATCRDERLEKLRLSNLLEETKGGASDVLVRVLLEGETRSGEVWERGHVGAHQVIADGVAAFSRHDQLPLSCSTPRNKLYVPDQDHFLLQLPILVELGADLPVEAGGYATSAHRLPTRAAPAPRLTVVAS